MDLIYSVLSLKIGEINISYENDRQLVEEIEKSTGVLSVCQQYYCRGYKIALANLRTQDVKYLEMIPLRKESARYFIKTPSKTLKINILEPSKKKIIDIISIYLSECKHFSLSFPLNEYAISYNSEVLALDYLLSQIPAETELELVNSPAYVDLKLYPITIKTLTGQQHEIMVFESDTVEELKKKVSIKAGVPCDQQRIIFAGKQLEDEITLATYNIIEGSNLNLVLRLRGGGCPQVFTFNDLSQEIKLEFSSDAPAWRVVEKGISWLGKCFNFECDAVFNQVISNLGFGVINVKTLSQRAECPICKTRLSYVDNCGFFKSAWEFVGVDHNGVQRTGSGEASEDNYTTFLEGENEDWQSLLIEVRPLDN